MDLLQEVAAFVHESEYLGLKVHLHKPHEKRKVVADIVAMPESTHHENIQGAQHFVFERRPFIHAFP